MRLIDLNEPEFAQHKRMNDAGKFLVILTIVMLFGRQSMGQDAIFSQFYANPLYLNPALAGTDHCTSLNLNYRNQPYPSLGDVSTYSFSVDFFVERLSGGLGLHAMHDTQGGLVSQTQIHGMYAYHGRLSGDWFLSFALQAGYIMHALSANDLVFPDQYTPGGILPGTAEQIHMDNSHSLDFSTGFLFYDDQWYAGGAIHHLFQPDIRIYGFSPLNLKYTIHAGYSQEKSIRNRVRSKVNVSPNVVFQYQSGFWRLNGGASFSLDPLVLGVWYRHSFKHPNSLIFQLGVKRVNYAIGYSYDYSLSGFSGAVTGAHEISVLLNLQCDDPNDKYRILNCPAF